jgi:Fe/S biogenesis protein NfuA
MQPEIIDATSINLMLKPNAIEHFTALIKSEFDANAVNLRITVTNPGTSKADIGITFCPPGEEEPDDLAQRYDSFTLYIENSASAALRDAIIDYKKNDFGGELFVKAPYIKGAQPSANASLQQRVQYIIDNEINPNLASHKGYVTLVDIQDNVVILRFGGGCHGCGMADVTLKSGIESALLKQCPDIKAVKDVTDHETGENPYYCGKQ